MTLNRVLNTHDQVCSLLVFVLSQIDMIRLYNLSFILVLLSPLQIFGQIRQEYGILFMISSMNYYNQ